MTHELSKHMDTVIAIRKKLEYLLFHPQSISSIYGVLRLILRFLYSASIVACAEALVWERILTMKDGLVEQSVSLPMSQIEVCLISGLVARMRRQARMGAVGTTVGAEAVEKS